MDCVDVCVCARLTAQEVLNERCNSVMNSILASYLSDSMTEVLDRQRSPLIKVATMSLYDIPSCLSSTPSPGSLVFAECFLDSAIPVTGTGGVQTSVDVDILYLTSHIPRHILWGVSENSKGQLKELKTRLEMSPSDKMGALLMTGDKVELTSGTHITLPPESVHLYVYQNGVAVYSEMYGAFALHATDCSHVQLFDGFDLSA
nr:hypothetical protein BaRGS_003195 [Batillaria attramentaria]